MGVFSNTVNFNVAGVKVTEPITKALRYGAAADAYAHPDLLRDQEGRGRPARVRPGPRVHSLTITLKNDAGSDPSVNKTFEATPSRRARPTPTPRLSRWGLSSPSAEGDLPAGVGYHLGRRRESRVFEAADGVTLSADNRQATFTLSDDQVYSLTLTNTVAPAPTPTPTPSGHALDALPRPPRLPRRPPRSWPRPVLTRQAWVFWLESSQSRVCLWLQLSVAATDDYEPLTRMSA